MFPTAHAVFSARLSMTLALRLSCPSRPPHTMTSAYIALLPCLSLVFTSTIPPSFYPPSRHRHCYQPSGDKGSRCEMGTSEVTVRCPQEAETIKLTDVI